MMINANIESILSMMCLWLLRYAISCLCTEDYHILGTVHSACVFTRLFLVSV